MSPSTPGPRADNLLLHYFHMEANLDAIFAAVERVDARAKEIEERDGAE